MEIERKELNWNEIKAHAKDLRRVNPKRPETILKVADFHSKHISANFTVKALVETINHLGLTNHNITNHQLGITLTRSSNFKRYVRSVHGRSIIFYKNK